MFKLGESISANVRDGFSSTTWLNAAALCQYIVLKLAPFNLAIIPPLLVVLSRFIYTVLAWHAGVKKAGRTRRVTLVQQLLRNKRYFLNPWNLIDKYSVYWSTIPEVYSPRIKLSKLL